MRHERRVINALLAGAVAMICLAAYDEYTARASCKDRKGTYIQQAGACLKAEVLPR
jgi:hypothetical protein